MGIKWKRKDATICLCWFEPEVDDTEEMMESGNRRKSLKWNYSHNRLGRERDGLDTELGCLMRMI